MAGKYLWRGRRDRKLVAAFLYRELFQLFNGVGRQADHGRPCLFEFRGRFCKLMCLDRASRSEGCREKIKNDRSFFELLRQMKFENFARKSPRSEEHTSELQSLMRISYAVFCLKKKNNTTNT